MRLPATACVRSSPFYLSAPSCYMPDLDHRCSGVSGMGRRIVGSGPPRDMGMVDCQSRWQRLADRPSPELVEVRSCSPRGVRRRGRSYPRPAVEFRHRRIRGCGPQDLIGLPKFTDLALQRLDPLAHLGWVSVIRVMRSRTSTDQGGVRFDLVPSSQNREPPENLERFMSGVSLGKPQLPHSPECIADIRG